MALFGNHDNKPKIALAIEYVGNSEFQLYSVEIPADKRAKVVYVREGEANTYSVCLVNLKRLCYKHYFPK